MITPVKTWRFHGGVHPADGKALSNSVPARRAPLLERYTVAIQQNIGAPPKPVVAKGDTVKKGQLIAEAGGFVSAPLHAPTSGTVGDIVEVPGANGGAIPAIEIISDGQDEWGSGLDPIPDWKNTDREILKKRIADSGIVGMGGAAFPTHVHHGQIPKSCRKTKRTHRYCRNTGRPQTVHRRSRGRHRCYCGQTRRAVHG